MNSIQSPFTLIPPADASLPTSTDGQSGRETVGLRATTTLVKVPSWFTVGAALRVAQLKGVAHLLVADRGAVVATISARTLATSPATDPLARWMTQSAQTVSPETSRQEAWRLMALQGLECLPVVSGMLLVGLVTRDDLSENQARIAG